MASGIEIMDEVVTMFNEMKKNHKYRYLVIRVAADLKSIIVEKAGEKDACYGDFLACLKDAEDHNENRYGIYDYPYDKDGQHKTKMVFYSWNPASSKIKQKMVYASSCDALSKKLDNCKFVNKDCMADVEEECTKQFVLEQDKV